MKTIYTTGHNGKIGQRLVKLGALPLDVNLTDKKSVEFAVSKIKDRDAVIIHCAAMSSVDECQKDYNKALAVNVWGTSALCEELELYGIKRMTLLSSEQIFDGFWGNYKEESKPNPVNDYGFTKLAAEAVVKSYNFKILRLSRLVSARDNDIAEIIKRGGSAPTFIKRSYSHIDFASKFIWQYANRYDEMPFVLNYGGEKRVSFYELAKKLNNKVLPRDYEDRARTPRPFNCGLNVSLAKKLNLPIQKFDEVIGELLGEAGL